jgi:hypothetical protein
MKKSLLLLVLIGGVCLLNACGGSSGGGQSLDRATHFVVTAPAAANAGSVFNFNVTPVDDMGNAVSDYSGTVRFTSTDGKAVLPANAALRFGGTGTFSATLETVGPQTITATDMATTTITGATSSILVASGATSLFVGAPSLAIVGKAFSFTVTAFDKLGVLVTNYPGTVTFTSTDGQAILPANSPLTNGTGSATFSATLNTAGSQTITATDIATASLTGSSSSIHVPALASGFTPTGGMAIPRESHTATLLNDGKVLVVGGDGGPPNKYRYCRQPVPQPGCTYAGRSNPLASTEQFDPASGSFTGGTLMSVPREFHTATLLQDGKVLVAGGDDKNTTPYDTAEIFDPSTNSFTPTSNMLSARSGHTASLLCDLSSLPCNDNKVLVTGGGSSTAELFDPGSKSFVLTGNMSVERTGHTATLLKNGQVLMTGGIDASGNPLATAELFNPGTGVFVSTGSMSVARAGHTATLLTSGAVLVAGGTSSNGVTATAELFDPLTGTFAPAGSMESPRTSHGATRRTDGKVLVTGGSSTSTKNQPLATAELFDPMTRIFTPAGNMEIERVAHTATLLMNGEVLITGGDNSYSTTTPTLGSAELFP